MTAISKQTLLPFKPKRAKLEDFPKALPTITRPGLHLRQWLMFTPTKAQAWFEELESEIAIQYKPKQEVMIKVRALQLQTMVATIIDGCLGDGEAI
jgi:hypothetical protein